VEGDGGENQRDGQWNLQKPWFGLDCEILERSEDDTKTKLFFASISIFFASFLGEFELKAVGGIVDETEKIISEDS
jgi:hypothetical protein